MIVTDRFVFLHLHKSGGTFLNECLLRFVPSARQIGYHLPRSRVPPQYADLPALGMVRSPWSYYVSWYAFQSQRRRANELFRILSEDGRLDFAGTLRNMLDLGFGGSKLDALLRALPPGFTGRGLNLPSPALERIRASRLGFYSFLYRHLFDGPGQLHVGRLEHMREDFPRILAFVGQPMGADMQRYLDSEQPRNVSRHSNYTEFYDDALRDLVAERDALIIRQHGYRFGF